MTQFRIDESHSSVAFSVRHLMISNVRGEFQKLSGSVVYDASRPDDVEIEAAIEVASISTRDGQRDEHLRSADFLDATAHPAITFRSRSSKRAPEGLDISGDLTIKGVTREVTVHASIPSREQKDPYGNTRIGATARTTLKRSDFGVVWNAPLEGGGFVIGDDLRIEIDVSLIKAT